MSNKFLWVIGVVVVVVLVMVSVSTVYNNKSTSTGEALVGNNAESEQAQDGKDAGTNPVSDKKGIKRFELKALGGVAVIGDGSITLKPDLTSVAVRLVTAPELTKEQKYEVYIQLATGSPVYAGEMFVTEGKFGRFLWGGAGKTDWYDAKKILVTKRVPTESKPGVTVAEAVLPVEGEAVTQ